MTDSPNVSRFKPVAALQSDETKDSKELFQMYQRAAKFLQDHNWVKGIEISYLGYGLPGVVGVFLFHVKPSRSDVDRWLWVITGDLPDAYLVADGNPTAGSAFEAYTDEMSKWVNAVKNQQSTDGLIPVNAPPTLEWAEQLDSRIQFLKEKIIPKARLSSQ